MLERQPVATFIITHYDSHFSEWQLALALSLNQSHIISPMYLFVPRSTRFSSLLFPVVNEDEIICEQDLNGCYSNCKVETDHLEHKYCQQLRLEVAAGFVRG